MTAPAAYLTIAEATAIIEATMDSQLDLRQAWSGASDANRNAALLSASDDIDAVVLQIRGDLHQQGGAGRQPS